MKDKDKQARVDLATMITDVKSSFPTFVRVKKDTRQIMKNFPRSRLPAVILHKRFFTNNKLVKKHSADNLSIECTFIKVGGEENEEYKKVLFKAKDVACYVQKTSSNVVVSLLHKAVM